MELFYGPFKCKINQCDLKKDPINYSLNRFYRLKIIKNYVYLIQVILILKRNVDFYRGLRLLLFLTKLNYSICTSGSYHRTEKYLLIYR